MRKTGAVFFVFIFIAVSPFTTAAIIKLSYDVANISVNRLIPAPVAFTIAIFSATLFLFASLTGLFGKTAKIPEKVRVAIFICFTVSFYLYLIWHYDSFLMAFPSLHKLVVMSFLFTTLPAAVYSTCVYLLLFTFGRKKAEKSIGG